MNKYDEINCILIDYKIYLADCYYEDIADKEKAETSLKEKIKKQSNFKVILQEDHFINSKPYRYRVIYGLD